jgi:asparagine synthase (glutamine-hydrolysing)
MCGIAGFVVSQVNGLAGREANETVLARMTGAIAHRGPDGEGFYTRPSGSSSVTGGSASSMLPPGGQPMANEEQTRWIVYQTGEIFNHDGVRPELERARAPLPHALANSETILHGWEEYGVRSLERYRGMFAFALWDGPSRTPFCARGPWPGIKPFCDDQTSKPFRLWQRNQGVARASRCCCGVEVKAPLPNTSRWATTAAKRRCTETFAGCRPGTGCGCASTAGRWNRRSSPTGMCRRGARRSPVAMPIGLPNCASGWKRTVRMRLMSDVPLGVFPSGGLDSSPITAITRTLVKRAWTDLLGR